MATLLEVVKLAFEVAGIKDVEVLAKAIKAIEAAAASADPQAQKLAADLQRLADTSAKLGTALDLRKKLNDNEKALVAARKSLADLNAEFKKTDKSSAEITNAFGNAERVVKKLTTEQFNLQTALKASNEKLKAAGIDTTKLVEAEAKLVAETKGAAVAVQKFATESGNAGTAAKSASNSVSAFGASLGEIASVATAAAAALAALKIGGDAIKGAAQVEQSLDRVAALAKGAQDEFAKLGDFVDEAARKVNVSSQQSAAAAAALAEQGKSATEIYAALVPTLQLAKIGQIEVAEAAGIVASAMDVFGDAAGGATHIVDVLTVASKGSKEGLAGLSKGLSALAIPAKELGLSFDQTVTILGLFTQNGVGAEKATKGLTSIFNDLLDPASKLRTELAKLGDNSSDFTTAIRTLATAGDLGKVSIRNLDTAQQTLITFLVQQGIPKLQAFGKEIGNAGGAADTASEKIESNLIGAFTGAINAFDTLRQKFVKPILGPLKDELDVLVKAFDDFAKTPAFKELQGALLSFVKAGIASIREFLDNVDFSAVGENIAEFGRNSKQVFDDFRQNVSTISTVVSGVVGTVKAAFFGLQAAVAALATVSTGAFTLLLSGVSKYVTAISELPGASETLKGVAARLRGAVEELSAQTEGFARTTAESAKKAGEGLTQVSDAINGTGAAAEKAKPKIEGLNVTAQGISPAFAKAIGTAATFAEKLGLISPNAAAAAQGLEGLGGKAEIAAQKVAEIAKAAPNKDTFKEGQEGGDKTVKTYEHLERALADAKAAADSAGTSVREIGEKAKDGANEATGSVATLQNAIDGVRQEFSALGDEAGRVFDEQFVAAFRTLGSGLTDSVSGFTDSLAAAQVRTREILGGLRTDLATMISGFNQLGDDGSNSLAKLGGNVEAERARLAAFAAQIEAGRSGFEALGSQDLGRLQSALEAARQKLQQVSDEAKQATQSLADLANSAADELDRANGNLRASEERRHQEQLRRIAELAKSAGSAGSIEAARAKAEEDRLHALKLKNIAEEEKARGSGSSGGSSPPTAPAPNRPSGSGGTGPVSPGENPGSGPTINFNAPVIGDKETLARDLIKEIKRITNLGG